MNGITLLMPPLAFAVVFAVVLLLAWGAKKLAFTRKAHPDGWTKSYACGEDIGDHMIQPDYGQFFPFAFFFTILHVVALMATTVPAETIATLVIAMAYILGAVVALSVLYRR